VFKKILLPLDGSANAEGAIPWAIKYAAPSRTPVVLIRVLDKVYPLEGMPFGAEADDARSYLETVARTLSTIGIPTETALPTDPVASSIITVAERTKCNLIILTTQGSSRIVRRLVGGVTEQVVRASPIPVLVVRIQDPPRPVPRPSRVLVPVDGSPDSKHVLAWAERLARYHGSPMEILYVRPVEKRRRAEQERRTEELSRSAARLCGLLRGRGIAASYRLEEGGPAEGILKACRATDLVVMTTHGYGGLRHLVKGSIAERVILGARAPVFVSKHGSRVTAGTKGSKSKGTKSLRAADAGQSGPEKGR